MTHLEEYRKYHHLSQSEVARQLGVSRACVNRAERVGIRNADAACRYALVLHCHPADLMEFDMEAAAGKTLAKTRRLRCVPATRENTK